MCTHFNCIVQWILAYTQPCNDHFNPESSLSSLFLNPTFTTSSSHWFDFCYCGLVSLTVELNYQWRFISFNQCVDTHSVLYLGYILAFSTKAHYPVLRKCVFNFFFFFVVLRFELRASYLLGRCSLTVHDRFLRNFYFLSFLHFFTCVYPPLVAGRTCSAFLFSSFVEEKT
jgi:hypothetical protein